MYHIKNISVASVLIILIVPISFFIVHGEQWIGKLNYYLFILFIFGCFALAVMRANDKILIAALIFFLTFNADYPLIYHVQIAGGTRPTPEIWLIDIPLLILLLKYIIKGSYLKETLPVDKKFKVLLFVFIIWEAITIFNAINYQSVVFQIVKDLRYFSIFFVLFLFINNDVKRLHFVIVALFCTIIFQNSWAIIQFIKQSTFNLSVLGETPVERVELDLLERYTGETFTIFGLKFGKYVSGFTGSSYLLARENLLLFPLVMSMYLSGRYIANKVVHITGMFLMVLGLIFGFSKSAWISVFMAFTVIFILEIKYKRMALWKIRFWILFFAAISTLFGRLLYLRLFKTNLSDSFDSRILLITFGIERFLEHPLMGVGANNIWLYFNNMWYKPTTVHNLYVLFLSEIGLVGLLIFLAIMLFILLKTISINKSNRYYYAISVGLTASFVAFYWDELWTWLYRYNPVGCLFWALCAIAFAAYNIANSNCKKQQATTSSRIRMEKEGTSYAISR